MHPVIRDWQTEDLPEMIRIWNQVVDEGDSFPQEEFLTMESGQAFFSSQTRTRVAEIPENGHLAGLYILHPNNVGRCAHIANASYGVDRNLRGLGTGRLLVLDSLREATECGFSILQFNAVVTTNLAARRLYEQMGFVSLGTIPGGFRKKDGTMADIMLYYISL